MHKFKEMILPLFIFSLIFGIIIFLITINISNINNLVLEQKTNKVITKYTNEYGNTLEEIKLKEFTGLIYQNNDLYYEIIIDNKTGNETTFLNYITNIEDFKQKEQELLSLKYPKFIVDSINNDDGNKVYIAKSSEVYIYYYDYNYDYEINEDIYIKIDYHEIIDDISFTPVLSTSYELEDAYNYQNNKKTIALTIDDGPSSKYNSDFLEVLSNNKAHATFFMVGSKMEECMLCVYNTYKSGNEIGSHTYEHMNMKRKDLAEINDSLLKTDEIYYKITDEHISLVRPPYGAYNQKILASINSPFILWSIDTEDWKYHDAQYIANYIIENVNDGDIVLIHELYETTIDALKIVLPKLYSMGYQVVSVSELANLKNINIENNNAYRYFK